MEMNYCQFTELNENETMQINGGNRQQAKLYIIVGLLVATSYFLGLVVGFINGD